MAVIEFSARSVGLCTVDECAAYHERARRTVLVWIAAGLLPVLPAGSGRAKSYLLRWTDVRAFTPPAVGWVPGKPRKVSGE